MASSSTGLDPIRGHRRPNRTASSVKRPANDHQQACPDPCGAFAPWQEKKGASFFLYFGRVQLDRSALGVQTRHLPVS